MSFNLVLKQHKYKCHFHEDNKIAKIMVIIKMNI